MRKLLIMALLAALFVSPAAQAKKKAKVIFRDDFKGASVIPDTTSWLLCTYKLWYKKTPSPWSQHFKHVKGYETVRVEDGVLKLRACKEDGNYKNGGVRTKFGFPNNSRVEVRAKLTKRARGLFPAIWQMPIKGEPWPHSGEIDLMEWIQDTPMEFYQTVHTYYINGDHGHGGKTNPNRDPNFDVTKYHVYAAERTDDAIVFLVDGKETFRYENMHLADEATRKQFPFTRYDYDIILNCSLGGTFQGQMTWPGPIVDEDLPAEMWVDWVKVTKLD